LGLEKEKRESQEELRQMLEHQDEFNPHQRPEESVTALSEAASLDPLELKQQLEQRETSIIHQLYNEHFKPTGLKNLIKDLPAEDQEKLLPKQQEKKVFDGRATVLPA